MATAGLYRRALPSPPAVEFASPLGKKLFAESLQIGTMEGFFKLISNFQTQSEPAYCGLASISMVLNALAIDPGRKWKELQPNKIKMMLTLEIFLLYFDWSTASNILGPWRWFDESMLDCCELLEKVRDEGITFAKVACLAICNGAKVEAFRTNQCTVDGFRQYVIACTSTEDCHVITSYHRKTFKQTGGGHFSPIGGYHAGSDMVLILDVARFKYPPHWVPLELLWEAMDTVDDATGLQRGFMILSRPQTPMSLLYTLSCKNDSWSNIVKQLIDDVPVLLMSYDVKDVQKVLSIVFASHPTNFGEFIKWVVEVRREEDKNFSLSKEEKGRLNVKEEVLKQVKETKLYKHVVEWLSSGSSSCAHFPSIGEKNTSLGTAPCDSVQGAEALTKKPDLPNKSCNNTRSCLEPKGDMKGASVFGTEQGMDMLVPSSKTSSCSSSVTDICIETQQARSDGLTVLLLSLPPHIWLGIKDENLLQEVCSLVSTESLTPLLQEEVRYLRRQLHFLKKCLDDELAVPSFT